MPEIKPKALTVCEPFASLLMLPTTDPRRKRVENRKWRTDYRGRLWIHAGMSRAFLTPTFKGQDPSPADNYGLPLESLKFGKLLGSCTLTACVNMEDIREGRWDRALPWLRNHLHTEGPWCWVLDDPVPLSQSLPWKGAQGLWPIDVAEVSRLTAAGPSLALPF